MDNQIKSCESVESQHYYSLNKELLDARKCIKHYESRRLSKKNLGIFFKLLTLGSFKRIIAPFKKKNSKPNEDFVLKPYKSFSNLKIVVYTSIFGKYDSIFEPLFVTPGVDYVILTDQELPKDSIWKKRTLPDVAPFSNMTPVEKNRYVKMLPHKLFDDYDISIYIDGNIQIITDVRPVVEDMSGYSIGIHRYPTDCIYDMQNAIIAGKRANKHNVKTQIKQYKKNGFPKHFGAFECNIIVRKHNDEKCKLVMDSWWEEFNNTTSKRDQLSFVYVLWKNGLTADEVYSLGYDVRSNPRFLIYKHK